MSNFYFAYVGNKRLEMKNINEFVNLKGIKRIVEPFCGSASFSRYCYDELHFKGEIILNDIDKQLMDFLMGMKQGKFKTYANYVNKQLKHLTKDKFKTIIAKRTSDKKAWFFFRKVYNYRLGLYPSVRGVKPLDISKFDKLNKFYQDPKVKLSCLDYKEVIDQYKDDQHTLIFFDPPYFDSFNNFYSTYKNKKQDADNIGEIRDTTCMFTDIVDMLKSETKVLAVLNAPCILRYIMKPFIVKIYDKQYSATKTTKEKINYKGKTKHMIVKN